MEALKFRIKTALPAGIVRLLEGTLLAVVLGQILAVWVSTCGTSPSATLAAFAAAGLSGFACRRMTGRLRAPHRSPVRTIALCAIVCGLSWGLPDLTERLLSLGAAIAIPGGEFSGYPAFLVSAIAAVGLFIAAATLTRPPEGEESSTAFLLGHGIGFTAVISHAAWSTPISATVVSVAVLCVGIRLLTGESSARQPASATARRIGMAEMGAIGSGLLLVASFRLLTLLMPGHANLMIVAAAELSWLLALASLPVMQRLVPTRLRSSLSIVLLGCVPLAFPWLLNLNFQLTALTDSVWRLTLARSAQLAILSWLAISAANTAGTAVLSPMRRIPWICGGCVLALLLISAGVSSQGLLAGGLVVVGIPLLAWILTWRNLPAPSTVHDAIETLALPRLRGRRFCGDSRCPSAPPRPLRSRY
ncbi:MAG: hypothetical protein R3C19_03510 [Planctomycetaceae bacterium]